jgi:hypothetical protein
MKNLYTWLTCFIILSITPRLAHAQIISAGSVTGSIVACSGNVSVSPYLQQFTVFGNGLTNNINITTPTNFELSTNATSGYASSLILIQNGSTVASTVVYIRSTATAAAGTISGNITLASTGADTVIVPIAGIINAIPTVNPISNQTFYSGITSTAINFSGTVPNTVYNWTNSNSSIGLATSGSGNIAGFTATNASCTPVTATVTVTPSANGCTGSPQIFTITVNPLPVLGSYTNSTLIAGQNLKITPSVAPINASSLVAYTNTNFTGILSVNPITGVVTVTNAKPAGVYNITLKATSTNGCITTATSFVLTVNNPTCSQSLFISTPAVNTTSGFSNYNTVAVGDFNGDGKQDIASAGSTVSIRLGNGDGTFGDSTQINVGFTPTAIAIGDFNGDGKQDFAAANIGGFVSIRLGNGLGGFSAKPDINLNGDATSIAIGDFNGDGKQDFIVASRESPTSAYVCLGDGTGGFTSATVGVNPHSTFIAIGDFNSDGKQDFVTAGSGGGSIGLGNGIGGFSVTSLTSSFLNGVAIGDFNEDGKQDIAMAGDGANTVTIRLGDGLGTFSAPIASTGTNAVAIAVGDFNGDGKQDIATASNSNPSAVAIRLGDGTGGFSSATNTIIGNGSSTSSFAVSDLNGDGKQDIVVTTTNLSGNYSSYISSLLGGANDINVKGNSISIPNGDNSPSITDFTDFGSVCSTGGVIIKTFTIENTGATALQLNSGAINFTGTNAGMFTLGGITLPTFIAGGASTTFTITFTPSAVAGAKTATVHIANNNCNKADYNFALTATVNALPQGSLIGNAACIADAGQFTYTASSGTAPYTLIISGVNYTNVRSGAPFNALPNPASTTTYTFTSAVDSSGCTSNFTNIVATITKYGDTLAFNNDVNNGNIQGANTMLLADGSSCRTVASILPDNADPAHIAGIFTAKVWVETAQPSGYVKRHYQITPATNAGMATATVILYFTQQEFTDFNAVNSTKLPVDATDAANNKANLLIEKRSGISSDGSGLPNTYPTATNPTNIIPTSVSWNATANRWEVTFKVTGFSGFFAKTQPTVLPVTLLSFTANLTNNKTTALQWNVTDQVNIKTYVVERSTHGNSFSAIGSMAANSLAITNYTYADASVQVASIVFYRLKIMGIDGTISYSQIVSVKPGGSNFITIFPNPAKDYIWLQGGDAGLIGTNALMTDMQGRIMSKTRITSWPMQIDISGFSNGVYFIKVDDKYYKVVIDR